MSVAITLGLWGWVATTSGLRVETRTPDALCPTPAQVSEAVKARLGEIDGHGEWTASYTIVHRPDDAAGDVLRLSILDPEQNVRLSREIPSGRGCVTAAQAMAVVIDNFFRAPAAETEGPRGQDRGGAPPAARPTVVAPAVVAAPAPSGEDAPSPWSFGVWAGFTHAPVASNEAVPTLALEGRRALVGRWRAGVALALPLMAHDEKVSLDPGTQASLRLGWVESRLDASYFLSSGAWGLAVGPELFGSWEWAHVADPVSMVDTSSGRRQAFGLGGAVRLGVQVARAWSVGLQASVDHAWGHSFRWADERPLLPPAPWRGFVGAGLRWSELP